MFTPKKFKIADRVKSAIFSKSVAEYLPYEELMDDAEGNGYIIYSDGTMGFGMRLQPIYLDSLTTEQRVGFHNAMSSFVNSIDVGVDVMQVVWKKIPYDRIVDLHAAVAKNEDPIVAELAESNVEFWRDRYDTSQCYGLECTIWLRFMPDEPLGVRTRRLSSWLGAAPERAVRAFGERVERNCELMQARFDSMRASFQGLEFVDIRRLSAQEIATTISHSIFREYRYDAPYSSGMPFRCQLGRRDFGRRYRYLTCGNDESRVLGALSIKQWPEGTFIVMINALLVLPQPISVTMTFRKLEPAMVTGVLKLKLKRLNVTGVQSDINAEARKSAMEITGLLDAMQEAKISMMDTEMTVVCEAKDWHELDRRMVAVKQIESELDMELHRENAALLDVFLASLPGYCRVGTTSRNEWITSSNLVDLLPLYGTPASASAPLMLLGGPYQTCYGFNPRDTRLDAYHAFIAGGTGSGKSFFGIQLLTNYMALNPRIYIVDRGVGDSASYKTFCEMLDGEYISVLDGKTSFNPFEGLMKEYNDPASSAMAQSAVVAILMEIVRDGSPDLLVSKRELVPRLVERTMARVKAEKQTPTLSMVYDTLDRVSLYDKSKDVRGNYEAAVEEMRRALSAWINTSSPTLQSRLLDTSKTTVSLDNRLVVFDLRGVEKHPELMRVLIHCINDLIMRGCMEYKKQPKILVFDEAWSFLESEEGAEFAKDMYKTARKLGLAVWSISQSIQDFSNPKLKDTIMNQSHQRFIFRLASKNAIDETAKALKLTDSQKELMHLEKKKGEFSEMLLMQDFSSGGGTTILRCEVRASALAYWIATTHPDDLAVRREYLEKGLSTDEALKTAALKYPHGVPEKAASLEHTL